MNHLHEIINAVNQLYDSLDQHTLQFSQASGIHCIAGCTHCCNNLKLEASVLEFLPLALHLYIHHEHDEVLTAIDQHPDYCIGLARLRSHSSGGCRYYDHRGLICRLFGTSAIHNKYNDLKLYTCHQIAAQPQAASDVITPLNPPLAATYQNQLDFIDPAAANDYNPINISIKKAIMKVAYTFDHCPPHEAIMRNAG